MVFTLKYLLLMYFPSSISIFAWKHQPPLLKLYCLFSILFATQTSLPPSSFLSFMKSAHLPYFLTTTTSSSSSSSYSSFPTHSHPPPHLKKMKSDFPLFPQLPLSERLSWSFVHPLTCEASSCCYGNRVYTFSPLLERNKMKITEKEKKDWMGIWINKREDGEMKSLVEGEWKRKQKIRIKTKRALWSLIKKIGGGSKWNW